jgi:hypothetical protein
MPVARDACSPEAVAADRESILACCHRLLSHHACEWAITPAWWRARPCPGTPGRQRNRAVGRARPWVVLPVQPGDYVDLRARFVTQMSTSERALHSRDGWGFVAGGGGDSPPDNFPVVPR